MSSTPKELECPLCQDKFQNPKTLNCLHSFCLDCLENLIAKNHSNIQLACPICRTKFQLEAEQLSTLPTDLFLLNSLEDYNSSSNSYHGKDDQIKCLDGENEAILYCLDCGVYFCGLCASSHKNLKMSKKHKIIPIEEIKVENQTYSTTKPICLDGESDATSYCLNCETYFCEICSNSHKKTKMFKSHNIIGIEEMKDEDQIHHLDTKSNPQNYCQTHQGKEIELFCDNCKVPICSLCVDQHASHKIQTLINIIENEKKPIIDLVNQVKPKEEEFKIGINKCEEVIKELEINSTTTQTQINQLFNKIRNKLDEKESELLKKLDETEKFKKKELELQKEELKFGIESIIGSCQMIENSLSSLTQNDVRLLSMKKLYHTRLNYLLNNKWKIEPRHHALLEFSICENKEQEIYSSLSKIGIINSYDVSGEKCLVSRNKNQRVYENQEYIFEIFGYSIEGKKLEKGGNASCFEVVMEGDSKDNEWKIEDSNNGNYQVKIKIQKKGRYSISVLCNGVEIQASPFQIQIFCKEGLRVYNGTTQQKLTIADGELYNPYGLAIDSEGNILVCDSSNSRVQVYSSNGELISSYSQFSTPMAITTNSKGEIIVSDSGNSTIQILNSEGKTTSTFGNGQLSNPYGICVDANDNIYVNENGNNRVQKFDSQGNFISTFGSGGSGNGQFNGPWGITINSKGNIIVCDSGNSRIQVFDSEGKFISTFGNDRLRTPCGICVDLNDNILVSDNGSNQVFIFNSNGEYITQFNASCAMEIAFDFATQNIFVSELVSELVFDYDEDGYEDARHRISVY